MLLSELWEELIVFAVGRGQETGSGNSLSVSERGTVLKSSAEDPADSSNPIMHCSSDVTLLWGLRIE